jgi:hypothetical protein
VRGLVRWAYSPLDCRVHLLMPAADLPWGVFKARCGAVLPSEGRRQHEQPPGGAHRTCPTCALIARRPVSVPADRWLDSQSVLGIAAQGCALAWCGALLTTQDLALRGMGTPCSTCLAAGSAS